MRGLFAKIFLSFWITGSIVMLASIVAVVFLHRPAKTPPIRVFQDTSRAYGLATVATYENGGSTAANDYLRELSKNTHTAGCLFNNTGALLAGEDCDKYRPVVLSNVAESSHLSAKSDSGSTVMALQLTGPSKRSYIFAAQIITGPHAPPTYDVRDLLMRGGISVLISGLVCYVLALFLTKPILRLRTVAQRMTAGDLTARVEGSLVLRRDELGEFARDFNEMAHRTETLVSGQRQLLYDVSHELRSPLARMNVAVDILRTRLGSDPNIGRIDSDLNQLGEMIGRILTIAKLETTTVVPRPVRIVLADLLASIAHDADFEAQERGARVEVLTSDGSVTIGDHNLVRSAVENVVRNAVRYTAPGTTVEIRLQLATGLPEPLVRISVRDYGPGVPATELKNIFAPFYRVSDEGSRNSKGVGLGLSITERIVTLHGGQIRAFNAHPQGLQVDIDLPLVARHSGATSPSITQQQVPSVVAERSPLHGDA